MIGFIIKDTQFAVTSSSGFRGGATPPSSGIRPPADPKGPLVLFKDIHFWLTYLKIFLKAPIYTNFEGERMPKKRDFLVEIFQECLKCLFSKISPRRRKFCQIRVFIVFWESADNQFGEPKKRSTKLSKFF